MRNIKWLILSMVLLSFTYSQKQTQVYEDGEIKCSYETTQGRLDGKYVSYYKSGQKKAEGFFENNYRIGKWSVWDSTGRLRVQRLYSDPFTFVKLFPETPKEKPIELLNVPKYSIKKNKDGNIEYFNVTERMVVFSNKITRIIEPINNPILFDNNRLFNILHNNIQYNNFPVYDPKDEYMTTELSIIPDTSNLIIVGFKLIEISFYDIERFVSESRIIGICPLALNKLTKDTTDLYWVYFPEIRKFLANEIIQQKERPSKIITFDDLFFYRYFHGNIYKETNLLSNKPLKSYIPADELEKEATRIQIDLIENEHDAWM